VSGLRTTACQAVEREPRKSSPAGAAVLLAQEVGRRDRSPG